MKKTIWAICMFIGAAGTASATDFFVNGKIQNVRSHSVASSGVDMDWVAVAGFTSAGSCLLSNGVIVLRVRDDERAKRQLAIAMAAKLAGNNVQVGVNDLASNKDQYGYCYLSFIDLQAQ